MSTVKVEQPHALGLDDAKAKLGAFDADIRKFGMKLVWSGHEAELKGTGASGSVVIQTNKVVVTIKLGMLAKAAGIDVNRLQGSIAKRLADALGSET